VDGSEPAAFDPARLESFVGRRVDDKYRVEALIGRGGMGAVYRAVNERIGRAVALKVLYEGHERGSESEQRFLREARIAGSLGHPNIVEIFDLGHLENGTPYQVMELLEGQTLAERIRHEGALPEAEALDVAEQVLSALEAAHARGVIHRDLKPENVVLVSRPGGDLAKLLDFGASKVRGETHSLTLTGMVVGTPYYLSPEQASGDRDLDQRIDLWAMGVLMYESLTGVLPFNADTYERLLEKIRTHRPVPPSLFQARLTPAVEALILAALSPSREERPASASAMLAALREARASAPARPPPTPEIEDDPTVRDARSFGEAPTELGRAVPEELRALVRDDEGEPR
jgi:serine/threonine-protein kinase